METLNRRQILSGLALAGLGASLSACASLPVITTTERTDPVSAVAVSDARAALNAMRRREGLPELVHNRVLQDLAEEQAAIMARTTRVAHTSEPGEGFSTRLRRVDFWGGAGENLAGGPPTLTSVIEGWMNSPAHHRVMVNPDYRQFGLAVRRGPSTVTNTYGTYWALIMGVLPPEDRRA
ncbi:CAP domain-containing protein [Pelagibacterium montanilacus]|uniref:CAP domain-containing protein n=1 Tax=Pelagibacterium montanilacus TaxID=2185280 RepID=UPI000F8F6EA4|nr:CAP domain-containing protein [Pelagibacterium montanilacus]